MIELLDTIKDRLTEIVDEDTLKNSGIGLVIVTVFISFAILVNKGY